MRRILVTGATGKVGQAFIDTLLTQPPFDDVIVRALCHNLTLPPHDRNRSARGSISDENAVQQAMQARRMSCISPPAKKPLHDIMDVAVKGLFWILEASRQSPKASSSSS